MTGTMPTTPAMTTSPTTDPGVGDDDPASGGAGGASPDDSMPDDSMSDDSMPDDSMPDDSMTDDPTPVDDDCEVVVSFDEAWGVAASGGGTTPMEWETDVVPVISDGVFSVDVPFESSAQQFGWNGDHPEGPVNCTGRELVARVRLLSGFVEDPESAPGGILMYLFSNEWGNNVSAWNNVPAPSEEWFEVSVGCESDDTDFDPALVNGVGFTFNSGGEDASSYTATTASFEVDHLCWRGEVTPPEELVEAGVPMVEPEAGVPDVDEPEAGVVEIDEPEAGVTVEPEAGVPDVDEPEAGVPDEPDAEVPEVEVPEAGVVDSGGAIGPCDVEVSFDSAWGVAGGGTDPAAWETSVVPTVSGGVFNVEVPFETAAQQFGWVGDVPSGNTDCTGAELVARVRLLSGFVEDPENMPGGVLVYLFSDAWGASVSAWNDVPAPSNAWFEASVGCATVQGNDFDPTQVNGIGFTFHSGGSAPTDYDATDAEFEVDHLCWRQ